MGLGYLTRQTPLTSQVLPLLKVPLWAPYLGTIPYLAGLYPGPEMALPLPTHN